MIISKQERLVDPASYISMIHVEPDCIDHPVTREIIARAGNIPVEVVSGWQIQPT